MSQLIKTAPSPASTSHDLAPAPASTSSSASAAGTSVKAQPPRWQLIAAFAIVYIVWGSTYLAIRFAVETVPPFLMTGSRFVLSGLGLYVIARFTTQERTTWRHWRNATWIGCLMFLTANALVSWAETMVPSGVAALIIATIPLWMVGLDTFFFGGQWPRAFAWIGMALGLVGVAILVDPFGPAETRLDPRGVWACLAACLSWSIGSLRGRTAAQPNSLPLAVSMQMLAGGVCLMLFATVIGEWKHFEPANVSAKSLWAMVYLIIFGGMLTFSCYSWLLRVCKASTVSTYAYVNPVIAVVVGSSLGGEPFTSATLFGATLIVTSVVLIVSLGRART